MKSWCIILRMPESDNLYVLAGDPRGTENALALVPVKRGETTIVKSAFGFDTENDALAWMDKTAELSEQGAKLMETCEPFEASKLQ